MATGIYVKLIGFTAGLFTTGCYFPQLQKIVKTKHTADISLGMFSFLTVGIFLWLIYGIVQGDIVIILANFIALIFNIFILYYKIKYG
ncbi:MAG: SemiSWEET transporter [bacterium]